MAALMCCAAPCFLSVTIQKWRCATLWSSRSHEHECDVMMVISTVGHNKTEQHNNGDCRTTKPLALIAAFSPTIFSTKPVQQASLALYNKIRAARHLLVVHLVLALLHLSCSVLHWPPQSTPKAASTSMPSHLAWVQTGDDVIVLLGCLPRLLLVPVHHIGVPQYDEY